MPARGTRCSRARRARVHDGVLTGAHVLGETPDLQQRIAEVGAARRGRAESLRRAVGQVAGVVQEVGRPLGRAGRRAVARRAHDQGMAPAMGPEPGCERAREQLDVRAGEGDVLAARAAEPGVARRTGEGRTAELDHVDGREVLAHDRRGAVPPAGDDDDLERLRDLLRDDGADRRLDPILVVLRDDDRRERRRRRVGRWWCGRPRARSRAPRGAVIAATTVGRVPVVRAGSRSCAGGCDRGRLRGTCRSGRVGASSVMPARCWMRIVVRRRRPARNRFRDRQRGAVAIRGRRSPGRWANRRATHRYVWS